VEYRPDKGGVIHLGVGKMSFDKVELVENVRAVVTALMKDKPSDAKGDYLKNLAVSATMGVGVKIDSKEIINSVI
jgi:large subunit ribosomal protein L1